jgi:hypothetical protein
MVGLVFYALMVLALLVVAYGVIRLAVRHGVMDANARTSGVASDQADTRHLS